MGVDGRRRRQPHGLADLPDRRGVALLPQAVADELEDLEPLPGQCLGHVALLVPFRRRSWSVPVPTSEPDRGRRPSPTTCSSALEPPRGRRTPVRDTVAPAGPRIKHLFVTGASTRAGTGVTPSWEPDQVAIVEQCRGQGRGLDTNTCSCCDGGVANTCSTRVHRRRELMAVALSPIPSGRRARRASLRLVAPEAPAGARPARPARPGPRAAPARPFPSSEPDRRCGTRRVPRVPGASPTVGRPVPASRCGAGGSCSERWRRACSSPSPCRGAVPGAPSPPPVPLWRGSRSRHHASYVVRPGDTLWSIAARLDPTGDPRPVVAKLEAQVGGDTVVPGEQLVLP